MHPAVVFAQTELRRLSDPQKATGMASYMYSAQYRRVHTSHMGMPFYGVQKPARTKIIRHIKSQFAPANRDEYQQLVTALWDLPHREEKYLAQGVATTFRRFVVPESLPLYQRFIDEGAWWDFVDETATHMIRTLVLDHPDVIWPSVDTWVGHDSLWRRRSAILCQVGAKERTDTERLFAFCAARAHETEFFIRKAIGWALREHAKTDPRAVAAFVNAHRNQLSGLSFREATKHIGELV